MKNHPFETSLQFLFMFKTYCLKKTLKNNKSQNLCFLDAFFFCSSSFFLLLVNLKKKFTFEFFCLSLIQYYINSLSINTNIIFFNRNSMYCEIYSIIQLLNSCYISYLFFLFHEIADIEVLKKLKLLKSYSFWILLTLIIHVKNKNRLFCEKKSVKVQ